MAKTDIGPRISVEGENEYKKQMKNIIQQQKEYTAELDSATAALGKNSTAQQRASAVAGVLKKQIAANESAIKLQNIQLQKAVAKYGESSTEASAYRTSIYKTNAELSKLKTQLYEAEHGLGDFAEKTQTAKENLETLSKTTQKNSFSDFAKSVAKGQLIADAFKKVSRAALDAGESVVKTGVSYNAQIEQYQVALTNMLGSEDQAIEVLNQIKADAARTPFDTAGLTKANQLLISAGVDAESSRQTILALGDAVSATGGGNEELSRMAQNLQQIKNAGKATSADIKQFAYAGIDVYGILADYTGKSTAEVQKMTVTYDLLTNALINASKEGGRYFDAMESQSQTINGRISTLKDNVTQLEGSITSGLSAAFGELVAKANEVAIAMNTGWKADGLTGMMDAASQTEPKLSILANAIKFCSENSDALKISIGGVTGAIVTYKAAVLAASAGQAILSAALTATPFGITVAAVGGLAAAVVTAYNTNETFRTGVDNLKESLRSLVIHLKQAAATALGYKAAIIDAEGFGGSQGGSFEVSNLTSSKVTDDERQRRKNLHDQRVWLAQQEKILSELAETTPDSSGGSPSQKAAADQKKLAKSVTDTSTQMLEGTGNIVGAIKQVTETADNTYNVYDGTTGKLKETTTETAQTITKTWTEVVDGVQKNFKQVDTLLDGVVQKTQITSDAVSQTQTSNQTSSQKIYGMEGVMGAVDRSTQITRETQKIWNEATGEFEDKIIESGKKVTDSFIRMNNGIKESVTVTKTYVGDQLTDTQEQVQALNDEIVDVQGTVGGFTKFILDLDTKLGGLETVANNLSNSPLGNWFSDLTKGYRADDSFWDDINLVSLAGSAVSGGISGYKLTGSPYGAAAGAIIGVIGNLLGTAISTDADTWGGDLVTSMAGGMEKAAPEIAAAASDIGETISSFLHFSCPDVGPLTEYETWMPDMVEGMAEGIRKNTYKIRDAAADLSDQLQMQLQYDVGQTGAASQTTNNRTVRMGGVTVQVYAAPGQSAEEVADSVLERLQWKINQEAASIGEPLPVL